MQNCSDLRDVYNQFFENDVKKILWEYEFVYGNHFKVFEVPK